MKLLDVVIVGLGLFLNVDCGVVPQRRDAFNPEMLMEHFMDVRTDQNLFGSYHPNDLVQSIVDYFQHGADTSQSNNQWGLFVYNPNEKMAQYMGNPNSPGNLGPYNDGSAGSAGNDEHSPRSGVAGFNANALNEKLMHSAFITGSQFSNIVAAPGQSKAQGHLGFDPDALNNMLMQYLGNQNNGNGNTSHQSGSTATSGNNDASGTNRNFMIGFNPDTVNAGLLHSMNSHSSDEKKSSSGQNSGTNTNESRVMAGFNPDALNAGLFSSLAYDPNSATGKFPSYSGNGEQVHGLTSAGIQHGQGSETSASGITNANSGSGMGKQPGQGVGMTATGTDDGQGLQTPNISTGSSDGQGMTGNMFFVNQNGAMPASGSMNTSGNGGNFEDGGLGSMVSGNQNSGLPPGVPSGSELKQTDATAVNVHGIGGMG